MNANEERWTGEVRRDFDVRENALALAGGLLFTAGLLFAMAHFDSGPAAMPVTTIGEARMAALPAEPPPPKPTEYREPVDATPMPFAGIDVGASDSVIKVAPTPPELAALKIISTVPPTAMLDPRKLFSAIRPTSQIAPTFDRVYDRSEVDQPPRVMSREDPVVPESVRHGAEQLRATLIVTIGKHGEVTSARVFASSGNPEFDQIIVANVRDTWMFSPALKGGKPVICLAQQPITVRWSAGSPFRL